MLCNRGEVMATNLYEGLKKMPKVELHAHLSGSLRYETLIELIKKEPDSKEKRDDLAMLESFRPCDLAECFKYFGVLHRLLKSEQILKEVTWHVLDDFRRDGCVYLELRTTPRCIMNGDKVVIAKKEYVTIILSTIEEFENSNKGEMLVRLILSVDRARSVEDGLETIELCNELKKSSDRVVGIDFSGDPKSSSLLDKFRPCLDLCRQYGLPSTIHIGEMWNDEADLNFVLDTYRPDRIGHAVCLSPSHIDRLLARPIPIEICPTSNVCTNILSVVEEHRFGDFYAAEPTYPLVVCTDDCGLFDTSLTRENFLIAQAFRIGLKEMFELCKRSSMLVFDKSENVREFFKNKFDAFEKFLVN